LDRNKLTYIPDAPRVAEQGFPQNFDWNFLPAKFFDSKMKAAFSEINLSSIPLPSRLGNDLNGNGMKASSSAFEILSKSNGNLNGKDFDSGHEEAVKEISLKASRPRTFK
jgi:hypothetical protein